MSVATYFSNISNVCDRQKQLFYDHSTREENLDVWSKFDYDTSSSQDSSSSAKTSESSKSDSLDMKPFKPRSINTDPDYFLQTPKKVLKFSPAHSKRITPRKPLKPIKSEKKSDPSFRGVTLQIKTNIKCSRDELKSQLVIKSYFTAKKKRSPCQNENFEKGHRHGSKAKLLPTSLETRFKLSPDNPLKPLTALFEENFDELGCQSLRVVGFKKQCASCSCLKTPLWRDAEDGTPLCNACGIRYRKYRVRCRRCSYIPKKGEKDGCCCPSCGGFLH